MIKKPLIPILAAMIGLAICGQSWALTLTGCTTPTVTSSRLDQCPEHPGYSCTTTAHDIHTLSTGYNPSFELAWDTVISRTWDPTGWTLSYSNNPIDAVLDVTTYQAYNNPPAQNDPHGLAGAEIRINWTPTAEQQDLKWVQAIHTNRPGGVNSEWFMDVLTFTKEKPPVYPYSYTDYRFYDKPGRWCEADQDISWSAYLYLARVDRTNKAVTLYDGLTWGFTIDCQPIPEPQSIAVTSAALCWLIVSIRRRRM